MRFFKNEQFLDNLIKTFIANNYQYLELKTEIDLYNNLQFEIETLNQFKFLPEEVPIFLKTIQQPTVFLAAKQLRDSYHLRRHRSNYLLKLFNQKKWCQNQIKIVKYRNSDGLFLFFNGLPLVMIQPQLFHFNAEVAIEAINKQKALLPKIFNYLQFIIVTNGKETRYIANNDLVIKLDKNNFFTWSNRQNELINEFISNDENNLLQSFLTHCQLGKTISYFVLLHNQSQRLIILRPYQIHAIETIVNQAKISDNNGYIWHTTGAGKSLTAFVAAQLLKSLPLISKILFVVDRNDLNIQIIAGFRNFTDFDYDVDDTLSVADLSYKLFSSQKHLLVTTIQKLKLAIDYFNKHHRLWTKSNEKVIIIYDECHRSQFGKQHQSIKEFFPYHQFFGFTGTPIFTVNAYQKQFTTLKIFHHLLHQYLIEDAIRDHNVLKFKYEEDLSANNLPDIERKDLIINKIIAQHQHKSLNRQFNALFAVNSIPDALEYYERFLAIIKTNNLPLKIALIFSNQSDYLEELQAIIGKYNQQYQLNLASDDFVSYRNHLLARFKTTDDDKLDLLIVVDMLLTGFDSVILNTLYLDKFLNYHNLLQAFSRTNRVYRNQLKQYGNIVSFVNLEAEVKTSLNLYTMKSYESFLIIGSYEHFLMILNLDYKTLKKIFPFYEDIYFANNSQYKINFLILFKKLLKNLYFVKSFAKFQWTDLLFTTSEFNNYQKVYFQFYNHHLNSMIKEIFLFDYEIETLLLEETFITNFFEILDRFIPKMPKSLMIKNLNELDKLFTYLTIKDEVIKIIIDSCQEIVEGKFIQTNLSNQAILLQVFANFKTQQIQQILITYHLNPTKFEKVIHQADLDLDSISKEDIQLAFETKMSWIIKKELTNEIFKQILAIYQIINNYLNCFY